MNSNKRLIAVYWGGFFVTLHYALVVYINSSFLSQFVSNDVLDVLYIAGSVLSIVFLSLAPFFFRKYGSLLTFLFFIALEMITVFGLGVTDMKALIIPLFIIHISANSILYFCLDVNLEEETKAESTTGGKRGIFLTAQNIAWLLSPLALIFLITQNVFGKIYLFSGIILIPLFLIAISLLLNKEMGFSWPKIGALLIFMLLPFLIFELPAGILSDKRFGEKELLIAGLIIMFLSTLIIPNLTTASFLIWAIVLFATRVGASLVEIGSETYFFKHVKKENTGIISLFRMSRPFAFIIVPLIALVVVHFFSYSASFYFLAFFTLSGLFLIPKVDTK